MKWFLFFSLLCVAACSPNGRQTADNGRQTIAKCEIDAVHLYPKEKAGYSTDMSYLDYVQTCMEAQGFVFDLAHSKCHVSSSTGGLNDEGCYDHPSN